MCGHFYSLIQQVFIECVSGPILGAGDRPVNKNGCCLCPLGPYTVLGETDRSSSYIRCQEVINDVKNMIKQHEENKSDEVRRVAILYGVVRKDLSIRYHLIKDPMEAERESCGYIG